MTGSQPAPTPGPAYPAPFVVDGPRGYKVGYAADGRCTGVAQLDGTDGWTATHQGRTVARGLTADEVDYLLTILPAPEWTTP